MDAPSREGPGGVLDALSGTLASGRAAVASFFDLIALEAQRAGIALLWIVALAASAALFGVSAWLGVMTALAMWAVSLGFPANFAVAVLAMLNLLVCVLLIRYCIFLSRSLLFPATRRQFAGAQSGAKPPATSPEPGASPTAVSPL